MTISLAITRTLLSLGDLTISDTGTIGTSGYVLISIDEGRTIVENTFAESRWIDGAALTSTRRPMTNLELLVRVQGTTVGDMMTNIAALKAAVDQRTYTVTATGTAVDDPWTCSPATVGRAYDRLLMRKGADLLTLSIPRQP